MLFVSVLETAAALSVWNRRGSVVAGNISVLFEKEIRTVCVDSLLGAIFVCLFVSVPVSALLPLCRRFYDGGVSLLCPCRFEISRGCCCGNRRCWCGWWFVSVSVVRTVLVLVDRKVGQQGFWDSSSSSSVGVVSVLIQNPRQNRSLPVSAISLSDGIGDGWCQCCWCWYRVRKCRECRCWCRCCFDYQLSETRQVSVLTVVLVGG